MIDFVCLSNQESQASQGLDERGGRVRQWDEEAEEAAEETEHLIR